VELYNPTTYTINLSDISLVALDGSPDIELSGTIAPRGYYLIERTDSTTTSVSEDLATAFSGTSGSSGLSNNENGAEVLSLFHLLGGLATTTLDETPALSDCDNNWCAGDNDSKQTMERVSATVSGSVVANWKSNNTFTKNGTDANGNAINGTPRAQNSVSLPPIGYYCRSYTESFEGDGYYIPDGNLCTYLSSSISGKRYGDLYRGTIASSTIRNGHSLGLSTSKIETDGPFPDLAEGDELFVAIYKVRTGPAFNDLNEFRDFFETGANPPPHLEYGIINWTYGTAP